MNPHHLINDGDVPAEDKLGCWYDDKVSRTVLHRSSHRGGRTGNRGGRGAGRSCAAASVVSEGDKLFLIGTFLLD